MSLQEKMIKKLQAKLDDKLGYRGDLHIADYRKINKSAAQLLLGYEKSLGAVQSKDITTFILKMFGGKVIPQMETAKLHKEEGAVTLIIEAFTPTRKLVDSKKMRAIASTRFVDAELGETWEVKSGEGGKYLARISDEDIAAIIQERKNRMAVKSSTLTLASFLPDTSDIVQAFNGASMLHVGDVVKFFFDNHILEGEISAVLDTGLKINADGKSFTVPRESVTEILKVSEQAEKENTDKMKNYFKQAYGLDLYAEELIKK